MENNDKNTEMSQSCKNAVSVSVIVKELLQKIKFVLSCGNEAQAERIIEQFVFYHKELTIEFAEWIKKECYDTFYSRVYHNDEKEYSSKELFEIFKQERDLTEH